MNRLLFFIGILVFVACGSEPPAHSLSGEGVITVSGTTPGARKALGNASVQRAGALEEDPCLGDSSDGVCYGLTNPDCLATQTIAVECEVLCSGFCTDLPATKLPSCVCDAGLSACDSIQDGGECRGDVLLLCQGGTLSAVDCGWHGLECVSTKDGAGCDAVGNYKNCGSLTYAPACLGHTWMRCVEGVPVGVDCLEQGLNCGWDPAAETYGCYGEEE